MSLRFERLLINIIVIIAVVSTIYLFDYLFRTSSNERIATYQTKLALIDNIIKSNDYNTGLLEIEAYLKNEKEGLFQVNLKARKAICLIHQGNILEAKAIFEELIETYPYIKLSQDTYKLCREKEDFIQYAGIIIDHSIRLNSMNDDKPELNEIFSSLRSIHYIQISYITGVIILLIKKRRSNKNKDLLHYKSDSKYP